jgi:hypothetical protein
MCILMLACHNVGQDCDCVVQEKTEAAEHAIKENGSKEADIMTLKMKEKIKSHILR